MKKIIIALSAIAFLVTACSRDFINPKHNSSEPLDEYFNTPERLFQCLVAAYDPLEWYDYAFGQYDNLHLIFDVMGWSPSLEPPAYTSSPITSKMRWRLSYWPKA